MISIPNGIFLAAYEAGAIFPVNCSEDRDRLWYPTLHCVVPFSAEIIIGHEPCAKFKARCFRDRLNALGYAFVLVEEETARPRDMADLVG